MIRSSNIAKRALLLCVCLFFIGDELNAQDFQPISASTGKNYFLGAGVGDAQLNVDNNFGTFGRSSYVPRITVELGQYRKLDPLFGILLSARLSYQQLRLHPINTDKPYNDVISFSDAQLRYGLYLGKDLIKLHLGGAIRFPLNSSFKVKGADSNGNEEWFDLSDDFKVTQVTFSTELGITFLIGSFHLSPTFSWNHNKFIESSFTTGPYSFDDSEYYTLEFVIYIPLKL